MELFKQVVAIQSYLDVCRAKKESVGFVPTMGALHQGHLALIQQALAENDRVVCSIFVNPTQFDDKKDLEKYPRPVEADIEKLVAVGCSVLFLPSVEEVYPENLKTPPFNFGTLDKSMEGAHRDGHFKGVAQVVYRLLDIVKPTALYMGQKDYQQFAIIKNMLGQLNSSIRLVRVPIVRELDGLAMSSRNVRLSKEGRKRATIISKTLLEAKQDAQSLSPKEVQEKAIHKLTAQGFKIDYFEIIDADTLVTLDSFENRNAVACTTVWVDGVRLLDNIILIEK